MLFNSVEYFIFLPIVFGLFYLIPAKYRWVLMLVASYFFYMSWKIEYIALIVASTLVDYFVAIQIFNTSSSRIRTTLLWMSILTNLGILFTFKYFNFFNDSFREMAAIAGQSYEVADLNFLLPVGISFYTFQTLSYTIDVYRQRLEPEQHLGRFALYVSFFPQLVAGPIERAPRLLPQLASRVDFDYDRIRRGLIIIAWGLFKKVVIADRIALHVDQVYGDPQRYNGISYIIATILFAFQIYCDFSGYSDIAIGSARLFGIDLMQNFRRPYFSRSIVDFWRRWHISLSTWFRDYVYIPLGGNRTTQPRWLFNLFITFVISGLWHGASWTFVIWGALHGLYIVVEYLFANVDLPGYLRLPKGLAVVRNFVLVSFAWIFFRADSFDQAYYMIANVTSGFGELGYVFDRGALHYIFMDYPQYELYIGLGAILLMETVHLVERGKPIDEFITSLTTPVRWLVYLLLITLILNLASAYEAPFIYFQF